MKLKIGERLALMQILPQEGNITTLRIIHDLRQALAISEEEHERYGVKFEGTLIRWDKKKDEGSDIEIGPVATKIIIRALRDLNKAKKMTEGCLPLWDMFMKDEMDEDE